MINRAMHDYRSPALHRDTAFSDRVRSVVEGIDSESLLLGDLDDFEFSGVPPAQPRGDFLHDSGRAVHSSLIDAYTSDCDNSNTESTTPGPRDPVASFTAPAVRACLQSAGPSHN